MSMRSPPGAAAVLLQVGPPASAVVAAAAGTAEAAAVRSLEGLAAAEDDVLPPRVASASAMRSCRVRAQCSAASAPPCLREMGPLPQREPAHHCSGDNCAAAHAVVAWTGKFVVHTVAT